MESFAHAFLLLMKNRINNPMGYGLLFLVNLFPLVPEYFPPLPLVPPSSFVPPENGAKVNKRFKNCSQFQYR